MASYNIIVDGLTGYGVERSSRRGFKSVRGFETYDEARSWVRQDQIIEAKAAQSYRAELRRRAAAIVMRAAAARERADKARELADEAREHSARCRAMATEVYRRLAWCEIMPLYIVPEANRPPPKFRGQASIEARPSDLIYQVVRHASLAGSGAARRPQT
jgi:hypothetical protein